MPTSQETDNTDELIQCWDAVDRYLTDFLVGSDPVLDAALAANSIAGLPQLDVSPLQGKLLHLLARLCRARTILEIGTLGGYSTIWLARALPTQGRMITLEADPRHAAVAQANIARAGLAHCVDVRVGRALDTLPAIEAEGIGPFDLIFIDADKVNNPAYLAWAIKLSRAGTTIIVDNIVRKGALIDASVAAPVSRERVACFPCWPTSRYSAQRRSRPLAAKDMTGLSLQSSTEMQRLESVTLSR